jgi:O-antigen/teichoic acid export membrane protein
VDLGTGSVAVRRSAADRWATAPVLLAARRIRFRLGLVGLAGVALTTWALDEPGRGWIVLAAAYPLTHVWELSATVFKNRLAWGVPVAIRAVAATLRLAAVGALALTGVASAGAYLAATAGASALANFLLHRAAWPHLPKPTIPVQPARGVLREAWPLGLALVCQQLYFYVDNLFVRALEGQAAVGQYNAAVRTLSVAIMVAQYASATGLPWLVRRGGVGDLGAAVARLAQPLALAAAVGAGALSGVAGGFLALVFGAPFRAAAPALEWLLGAAVAIHVGAVALTAVVSLGRPRAVLAIAASALALNLVLNALLVPRLGIEGAAIATLATEVAVALGSVATLVAAGANPLGRRPWVWVLVPIAYWGARAAAEALAG